MSQGGVLLELWPLSPNPRTLTEPTTLRQPLANPSPTFTTPSSVWDHCITLTVACGEEMGEAGTLSLDTAASDAFGAATPILGEPGGKVNEMWRGVTVSAQSSLIIAHPHLHSHP